MIKLDLPHPPDFLSEEFRTRQTTIFMADNTKRVWNSEPLKKAVFDASFGKCVYSEMSLNEEGKDMQIDHFYPKSKYPDKVLEWGNLLACSNVCNRKKRDTDPINKEIVNPFTDNPKDFFYIRGGRLFPKDNKRKAINTIEICDLNNQQHFRKVRYDIEKKLCNQLDMIAIAYKTDSKKALRGLRAVLEASGRRSSYSATKSTLILHRETYRWLKEEMIKNHQWSPVFISLEQELIFCSLS